MKFDKKTVKSWMRAHKGEVRDPRTNEFCATSLAENACRAFGTDHLDGPLDDETHWVWDLAVEVAS